MFFFFFFLNLNLNFGFQPSKHTNVAILFANCFSIVFNIALVSNITPFFFLSFCGQISLSLIILAFSFNF